MVAEVSMQPSTCLKKLCSSSWFKSITHVVLLFMPPFCLGPPSHCQFLQPVGDIDLDSFEAVSILCCYSLDNLLVSVSSIGNFYTLQIGEIISKIILPIIHTISMTVLPFIYTADLMIICIMLCFRCTQYQYIVLING